MHALLQLNASATSARGCAEHLSDPLRASSQPDTCHVSSFCFQASAMEAIAGLSLAANILQVVDSTKKVLSSVNQIRQSGSTVQISDIELLVADFTALNERITSWARPNPASSGPLARDSQVRYLDRSARSRHQSYMSIGTRGSGC